MKVKPHSDHNRLSRSYAVEGTATRAFSTTTVEELDRKMGAAARGADRASATGGDGGAVDADTLVTAAELRRYRDDFAPDAAAKATAKGVLALFKPDRTVSVKLPKAVAPVTEKELPLHPNGVALVNALTPRLQGAAAMVVDLLAHLDSGRHGTVTRTVPTDPQARVSVEDVQKALAPENRARLAGMTDSDAALQATVNNLGSILKELKSTTIKNFVPATPPEYVTALPLHTVKLELVTVGTEDVMLPLGPTGPGVTPSAPPEVVVELPRFLQLKAPEGCVVVLKTESAGEAGMVSSEVVLDGNDAVQDVAGLAGITEGVATTLVALVFQDNQLVENVQMKLPANPIVRMSKRVPLEAGDNGGGSTPAPDEKPKPARKPRRTALQIRLDKAAAEQEARRVRREIRAMIDADKPDVSPFVPLRLYRGPR